jgi:hypothetical protein
MGQTLEEHRKNYNEKIYHLQCQVPLNRGHKGQPVDVYYHPNLYVRYRGYRTARQVLDAIKSMRRNNITSWGLPWRWRIKIVK